MSLIENWIQSEIYSYFCSSGAISTTARALSVWLCLAFTIDRWISMWIEFWFREKKWRFCFWFSSDLSAICWSTLLYNKKCTSCYIFYLSFGYFLCRSTSIRIRTSWRTSFRRYSFSHWTSEVLSIETKWNRSKSNFSLDLHANKRTRCLRFSSFNYHSLQSTTPSLNSYTRTSFSSIQCPITHKTRYNNICSLIHLIDSLFSSSRRHTHACFNNNSTSYSSCTFDDNLRHVVDQCQTVYSRKTSVSSSKISFDC